MATIIEFPRSKHAATKPHSAPEHDQVGLANSGSATIHIFNGIRVERLQRKSPSKSASKTIFRPVDRGTFSTS